MKNNILLISHLLLAVTCIYISDAHTTGSLAVSLSIGYLSAITITYISPLLRTKAQAQKLKHYDKPSNILLICIACIVSGINIYYLLN